MKYFGKEFYIKQYDSDSCFSNKCRLGTVMFKEKLGFVYFIEEQYGGGLWDNYGEDYFYAENGIKETELDQNYVDAINKYLISFGQKYVSPEEFLILNID